MPAKTINNIARRDFLKLSTAAVCAASARLVSPAFLFGARQKTLKILQWKHPIPGYDQWFSGVFARQWGEKNDTHVIVDHVPLQELGGRVAHQSKRRSGSDVTMFVSPPALFEDHVIDHAEIYQEVQARHGQMIALAQKSTFNPISKKYFAFSDCYMPLTSNWLAEPWVRIGLPGGPNDYGVLRQGAKLIRKEFGIPCGLGASSHLAGNVSTRTLLWSFGGRVQDSHGNVAINSRGTIEALKYLQTLYRESGTAEALDWGQRERAHALLHGKTSFTMSAIFLTRSAEKTSLEAVKRVKISPAPRGAYFWLACPHITSCYVVWNSAENKEGASRFLVDLIDNYKAALKSSELCNLPCFPSLAPNLLAMLEHDPQSDPPYKYIALEDSLHWTRNIGYPGYASAAIGEVFNAFVVPKMFERVLRRQQSPEDSAALAERETKAIFARWKTAPPERG